MKNIYLSIIIINSFYNLYSQESLFFKVEYKPNHLYTQMTEQSSIQEMTFIATDDVLEKLKSKGIENPTIKNTSYKIYNLNKTGSIKNDEFPITIEIKDTGDKDVVSIIPIETKIYGKVKIGEKPTLDSINSPKMDAEQKRLILSTMQTTFSQITLPNNDIKVGETFTREMPLNIPIGKENLKMTNTITYKLIKIENKKAFFDIIQDFNINITDKKDNLNAKGSGDGVLVFDIQNNFYLKYELNSEIKMEIDSGPFTAKVISKSRFVQNTTITEN